MVQEKGIKVRIGTEADLASIRSDYKEFELPLNRSGLSASERLFVGVKDGVRVGYIMLKISHGGKEAKITQMCVRKGFNRRGIGSKLLGIANASALRNKLVIVEATAYSGSRGFWEKTNYNKPIFYRVTNSDYKFGWVPTPNPRKKIKKERPVRSPAGRRWGKRLMP